MSKIKSVGASSVLNSRGTPTIETTVVLSDGTSGRSAAPSGILHEVYEALPVYDESPDQQETAGVSSAIKNVNEIIGPALVGMDVFDQQKIDRVMIDLDGTQNKNKLGANATLSVSCAVAQAGAKSALLPLPLYLRQFTSGVPTKKISTPMFDLMEGDGGGTDGLSFQEFLLIPASSKSFSQSLDVGTKIYLSLKKILSNRNFGTLVAARGGFSPNISSTSEALSLARQAIEDSGFSFSLDAFLGIDAGAGRLADGKRYKLKDRTSDYTLDELFDYYKSFVSEFSLIYLEDPFASDDWEGWKKIFSELGEKITISGGDLVATNPYRLQLAMDNEVINAVTVKPSQIGTISEAIAVVEIARFKGLKIIVSDRSVETMDSFIADFGVGVGADYVKFGAPARERVVKYNKLLKIEEELAKI